MIGYMNVIPIGIKITVKIGTIHDKINLSRFLIPGLIKLAPYLIRGNPVFPPPGQRPSWAGGWIPAFAGMTCSAVINDAVYNMIFLYPFTRFSPTNLLKKFMRSSVYAFEFLYWTPRPLDLLTPFDSSVMYIFNPKVTFKRG